MALGSETAAFFGAAGAAASGGGYTISRSLRFNSADSAYLSRTPGSAGNRKTWTWSGWVKRSKLNNQARLFNADTSNTDRVEFMLHNETENYMRLELLNGTSDVDLVTSQVFRDTSSWYHIVLAVDTTQSTSSNRVKIYVNGAQITSFSTTTYPNQNAEYAVNATTGHSIGRSSRFSRHFDGYLADVIFVDGQALDPTSFGEFDTNGVWQPIEYTGSWGTNGFHLDFADNSSAAALGYDAAGSNDWTVNNLSVTEGNGNYLAGQFSGTQRSGFPWSNVFDANTTGDSSIPDVGSTWTWTPTTSIPFSTLQIWCYKDGTPGDLEVNGTSVVSQVPNHSGLGLQLTTITGISSPLTSIKSISTGTLSNVPVGGIVIDGTLLIDNSVVGVNNDSLRDSPTNGDTANDTGLGGQVPGNYCTWNPLCRSAGNATITNGNLDLAVTLNDYGYSGTIFVPDSGKWYFEVTLTATSGNGPAIGIVSAKAESSDMYDSSYASGLEYGGPVYAYNAGQGTKMSQNASDSYVASSSPSVNDTFMVAVDFDNGAIYFGKNGTWLNSGVPTSGASKTGAAFTSIEPGSYSPVIHAWGTGITGVLNAGARAFAYTAPSGFKALCTVNLPTPTIEDPSTVMDVKLWTGNGVDDRDIEGLSFSPDLVWIKGRVLMPDGYPYDHNLFDTVRGATKSLSSNTTSSEKTNDAYGYINQFNPNGFRVTGGSTEDYYVNQTDKAYVAWTWDAGSSTVSNTDGSITSSVRANASAGFSIVTWTMQSSGNSTVGHGLNVAPSFWMVKNRTGGSANWGVYHSAVMDNNKFMNLNDTAGVSTYSNIWGTAVPTSTVFGVSTAALPASSDCVGYFFAPVAGYSSMGSFVGNGSSDGVFVYTGHQIKFLLIKNTTLGGSNWRIIDTARNPYNVANLLLNPNSSNAEQTTTLNTIDLLSNGFKCRGTDGDTNSSGDTFIYCAFASHPFQTARAR